MKNLFWFVFVSFYNLIFLASDAEFFGKILKETASEKIRMYDNGRKYTAFIASVGQNKKKVIHGLVKKGAQIDEKYVNLLSCLPTPDRFRQNHKFFKFFNQGYGVIVFD